MASADSTLTPAALTAAELVRGHRGRDVLPDFIIQNMGIDRWQAIEILKELADFGYGTFVLGRRGGKTRLQKSLAIDALVAFAIPQPQPDANKSECDLQVFNLRRQQPFQVKVPGDLTSEEADTLGKWLTLVAIQSSLN